MFLDENFILEEQSRVPYLKETVTKEFDKARLKKEEIPISRGGGFDLHSLTQEGVAAQTLELKNKVRPKLVVRLARCRVVWTSELGRSKTHHLSIG